MLTKLLLGATLGSKTTGFKFNATLWSATLECDPIFVCIQVVQVPSSRSQDAKILVQMGSMQVAVKVNEIQQKQVK